MPLGKYKEMSLLPYFPGYLFDKGKSIYRDEEVGEGGYVYAEPGVHTNVALLDIASMHPHSIIAECLFGPRFTRVFKQIVDGRVSIKHKAWDELNDILDGKLAYHIGASIKDAGKKCFAISLLEDPDMITDLLNRLKKV